MPNDRGTITLDPRIGDSIRGQRFKAQIANKYAVADPEEGNVMSKDPTAAPPPLVQPRRSWLPFILYALALIVALCAAIFSSLAFSALIAVPAILGIFLQRKDYEKRMRAIGEAVVAEAKYIHSAYSSAEYAPYLARARQSFIKHGIDDLLIQLPQN
jgi:hypothetical protein